MLHRWGNINRDDLNSEKSYRELRSYMQSTLANILFTRELARRLRDTRVTVNALHPGVINTQLARHGGKISVLFSAYLLKPFMYLFYKTPWQGAQTTIYAGKAAAHSHSERTSASLFIIILSLSLLC
jgi:NAD(P)-dependent dehydrogenase (short-subunit alcohol dehydrogenase family)